MNLYTICSLDEHLYAQQSIMSHVVHFVNLTYEFIIHILCLYYSF